ncbi:hypothetical protein B7Z17_01945, partial [Candidatus Saccharibacteria bacterium 32-49-10]
GYERYEKGRLEYERLERKRLVDDEISQASERLHGAMNNRYMYAYEDGDFWFNGEPLSPIFDKGIEVAGLIASREPEFETEYVRRLIERQQLEVQKAFVEMYDEDCPQVLIHVSRPPSNAQRLNYDTERNMIMVRVSEVVSGAIQVRSMSLDGDDDAALRAVLDMFGFDMPYGMTSEALLAENFLVPNEVFQGRPVDHVIRERYDAMMAMQYGGAREDWYAGRRDTNIKDTKATIEKYPWRIEEHLAVVETLKARYGERFRDVPAYEQAVINFVSVIALEEENDGSYGGDYSSAGESASSQGISVGDGACPTGVNGVDSANPESAEAMLRDLGIDTRIDKTYIDDCMNCPLCRKTGVLVEIEAGHIDYTCLHGCGTSTKDGAKTQEEKSSTSEDQRQSVDTTKPSATVTSSRERFRQVDTVIGIGSAEKVYEDTETGYRDTEARLSYLLGAVSFSALLAQQS